MDYELLDALIQGKKACFEQAADQIWEFAELRYQEHKSAKLQKELLRKEGFTVEEELPPWLSSSTVKVLPSRLRL